MQSPGKDSSQLLVLKKKKTQASGGKKAISSLVRSKDRAAEQSPYQLASI